MRALFAFAALALSSLGALAQAPSSTKPAVAPAPADTASLAREIADKRATGDTYLPDASSFSFGDRTIPANTTVDGPIAVARGTLDVYGTINGDAVALDGDVRVHSGGRVTGDAWAAAGSVIIQGGVVAGQKRAFSTHLPAASRTGTKPLTTAGMVKLTIAWFAVLAFIGLGVMIFAEGNLTGVVVSLERGFAKAFWIGLAGQLVLLPALLVLVVALAITVLGILLIPFAVVAFVIAADGLATLGFLAVARVTGGAFASRGPTTLRGAQLRALVIGLVIYLALWLLAAAFAWNPFIGSVLRAVAIAVTWVAATAGLGATIRSRAGTVRPGVGSPVVTPTDELAWQTPTPVSGVAAATRKVASSR